MKLKLFLAVPLLALALVITSFINAMPYKGVPILVYHEIGAIGSGDREMFIDRAVFRSHMEHLKKHGYTTITLRELYAHYAEGAQLPQKPVVLTFDDGYVGVYENGWPIMRELGFTGVLFVTGHLGQPSYMTESQVETLLANGFELGNHTRTHRSLPTLNDEELKDEIVIFQRELESRFGVDVVSFCYPMGDYDERVVAAVRQASLRLGVTTNKGFACTSQGLLTLRRTPLFRFDTMADFRRKLQHGK